MIWCGNFNRHHPLLDKEQNGHLLTASAPLAVKPLISLIDDYNMVMLLPKGIPTLQSMAMKNWTRVDNVFMMANTEELMVVCNMDPRLRGLGMHNMPILTMIDILIPQKEEAGRRNFREMDWDKFRKSLEMQLGSIPTPCHTDKRGTVPESGKRSDTGDTASHRGHCPHLTAIPAFMQMVE